MITAQEALKISDSVPLGRNIREAMLEIEPYIELHANAGKTSVSYYRSKFIALGPSDKEKVLDKFRSLGYRLDERTKCISWK